ncbi:hypothetical protein CFP56_026354 [Quercus suber]|uniref:Uncharacterized protein n=1 Tax=Quercus suber TaxID=58331 RepID=A0AAW0K0A1_QUESU|nr:hypothetical protein CFP56_14904 [Quercus suber]
MAGENERVYTSCLRHEEDTDFVAPVCTYNYIGEVLHIYVEAAGATPVNTTVSLTNVAPYELTVEAVVQRPNRGDRHYRALLPMPRLFYLPRRYFARSVSDGFIHVWFPFQLLINTFQIPQYICN